MTAATTTNTAPTLSAGRLTHLQRLEAEAIQIMREAVAEAERPALLYSMGKDSSVLLRLAVKAFYPSSPPMPLVHVDTLWKFQAMYAFRDAMAAEHGLELIVHHNPECIEKNINPIDHGSAVHTDMWKTEGLKQIVDERKFDVMFGGARRDEEKSRAKERVFSIRSPQHQWDPKRQRPELWQLYNGRRSKGETVRVFPISNWTELDVWQYIHLENIPLVELYFAKPRPVVERDGTLIVVDDDRMPLAPGEVARDAHRAVPHARVLPADWCDRVDRRHVARDHPGDVAGDHVGAPGPRGRSRRHQLVGEEEAGRPLLMADAATTTVAMGSTADQELIASDIDAYLTSHQYKSLLRFITCGSVDDGKSTLIGRLLYETHLVFEDHLAALEIDSAKVGTQGGDLDFALLLDGLSAEREQGITIDVAYRFFATEHRKFIVADTPGHEQYTRNMVTGASTADVAIILVDARKGVLTQTRRHSYLVSLLGIKRVVVAINKMDLMDYSARGFLGHRGGIPRLRAAHRARRHHVHPAVGVEGRQHRRAQRAHAVVSRPDAPRLLGDGAGRRRPRGGEFPHAGAVGEPPQPRLPRVLRSHRRRLDQTRRPDPGAARGHDVDGRSDRHDGRRPR